MAESGMDAEQGPRALPCPQLFWLRVGRSGRVSAPASRKRTITATPLAIRRKHFFRPGAGDVSVGGVARGFGEAFRQRRSGSAGGEMQPGRSGLSASRFVPVRVPVPAPNRPKIPCKARPQFPVLVGPRAATGGLQVGRHLKLRRFSARVRIRPWKNSLLAGNSDRRRPTRKRASAGAGTVPAQQGDLTTASAGPSVRRQQLAAPLRAEANDDGDGDGDNAPH